MNLEGESLSFNDSRRFVKTGNLVPTKSTHQADSLTLMTTDAGNSLGIDLEMPWSAVRLWSLKIPCPFPGDSAFQLASENSINGLLTLKKGGVNFIPPCPNLLTVTERVAAGTFAEELYSRLEINKGLVGRTALSISAAFPTTGTRGIFSLKPTSPLFSPNLFCPDTGSRL
jgi:hypothetical protein